MQRYNMFHQIHMGLRALLYETALRLQHTDFWHLEEAEEAVARIEEVTRLFEKHAYSEDNHIFSAIEKYDPAIADAFEQEHVQDHALSEALLGTISLYKSAPVITEKIVAAKAIHAAYVKFMVFNLEHMAKEEEVLNPLLWRYYTDSELKAITHRIVAGIEPGQLGQFNVWMMRGLNNEEITGWLKEVEKNAPEQVFQELFTVAEKELPQRRFRQILESLTEGAMLA